ncbi:hypothetical protein [Rhodopseudomonas palustris]|uniref:hypothetical protein n=1 Tax=Rhodopseudomonas palustris TaxID=1076 RepID=UPI0011C46A77|nr:hypothetical protein [Rhodopseudomonas palustris]
MSTASVTSSANSRSSRPPALQSLANGIDAAAQQKELLHFKGQAALHLHDILQPLFEDIYLVRIGIRFGGTH